MKGKLLDRFSQLLFIPHADGTKSAVSEDSVIYILVTFIIYKFLSPDTIIVEFENNQSKILRGLEIVPETIPEDL